MNGSYARVMWAEMLHAMMGVRDADDLGHHDIGWNNDDMARVSTNITALAKSLPSPPHPRQLSLHLRHNPP
jgi:hypothetical protein